MSNSSKNKSVKKESQELREDARIGDKNPGRNLSEKSDIEQTRIEYRRDADLEDKTPAGDAGPEDETAEDKEEKPQY